MKKVKKRPFLGECPQTRFIDSYLLVDEAHNIMPYEFPVLSKLLLQGREFGVGVILASQFFSHFKTNKENYMEPIQSWFVHKVPGIKVSDLDRIGLPNSGQSTINRIASLEVFESLCKTLGHNGDFIKGIPFYKLD
jgi:DNA phosphorothioation-dependent restriction protein DptH